MDAVRATHTTPQHQRGDRRSLDPASAERKRRENARRPRLAASRHRQEREREREMHQQAAEASRFTPRTSGAHPRHVSPYRNHAKQSPSSETDPAPLPEISPRSTSTSRSTKWGDPNQTLCLLGNTVATKTPPIIATRKASCQGPTAIHAAEHQRPHPRHDRTHRSKPAQTHKIQPHPARGSTHSAPTPRPSYHRPYIRQPPLERQASSLLSKTGRNEEGR